MSDDLEQLSSQELHDLAVHRAKRHLDAKFFWQLMQTLPAAEAAAGELDEAETDVLRLSAHVDDVTQAGEGEVAEMMRPFYLDYLRRHNVTGPVAPRGTQRVPGVVGYPLKTINFSVWRCQMSLTIGDTAPDFEAETTEGPIKFHDWIGDSWAVLFSHPRDFTPVCTTELGYMARIKPDFDKRNVKIIGVSVDPSENHEQWVKDIEETQGATVNYPLIADTDFNVAKSYGMLPADVSGDPTERTPAQNSTLRNVFVIGPDKKIKLILVYPMTTGRNFDEVLRVIDSLQLTANHQVATPAQWNQGDDVIIAGSVSNEQAKERYPDGWEEPKPYIRIVPDPVHR